MAAGPDAIRGLAPNQFVALWAQDTYRVLPGPGFDRYAITSPSPSLPHRLRRSSVGISYSVKRATAWAAAGAR